MIGTLRVSHERGVQENNSSTWLSSFLNSIILDPWIGGEESFRVFTSLRSVNFEAASESFMGMFMKNRSSVVWGTRIEVTRERGWESGNNSAHLSKDGSRERPRRYHAELWSVRLKLQTEHLSAKCSESWESYSWTILHGEYLIHRCQKHLICKRITP